MIGHLGARVSALLDGQLSQAEAEEAWAHVYACHACRDLVEREGYLFAVRGRVDVALQELLRVRDRGHAVGADGPHFQRHREPGRAGDDPPRFARQVEVLLLRLDELLAWHELVRPVPQVQRGV